ncbi:MAG: phosphate ABC transporter ATP-binding protein PstB [Gammaproteobacteria bacterium]|nr:phosphate ABC transporter ATP-binding protein PstB [Gammaproteobacteria bacterium]
MSEERADGHDASTEIPEIPTPASSIEEAPSPNEWKDEDICLTVSDLCLHYGDNEALTDISMRVVRRRVTALIGPSGCGKSTLLRCFNRMNDLIDDVRITGEIELNGMEIHSTSVDIAQLRRRVGMVFQRPNPFPKSIYENVAYGLRLQGGLPKSEIDDRVEWALKNAALWGEVSDRLNESALDMSGGQQQRLVIARAIAVQPDVLLLDEPASALDPISTLKIEELIHQLKQDYTILIVTHNMQQAARVSDYTGFLYLGKLVEYDTTNIIFTNPSEKRTEDYITGRYG